MAVYSWLPNVVHGVLLLMPSLPAHYVFVAVLQLMASSGCSVFSEYKKGKGSLYSITERGVPELIAVLGSQPAGDASHKPNGRLPLLSASPAVTLTTLKRAATSVAAW